MELGKWLPSNSRLLEMFKISRICSVGTNLFFNHVRHQSTIFALSSGSTRSAIAVIRISGPKSSTIIQSMACLSAKSLEPRKCVYRKIVDPSDGKILDRGMVVWFPGPKSYTGEDSVEFHVHGGIAVVASILSTLQKFPGCRIAEPGEFTKRAYFAGKLDATEVEGLADLLKAETEIQRQQAIRQAGGELTRLYNQWRNEIIKCMAHLEAFIDFGEDQDIGNDVLDHLCNSLFNLRKQLETHLNDDRRGERTRNGVRVAIIGEPNVGKSSLLNLLSRKQMAIVSPHAGTTRDVLESSLDIGGYPVVLCDTAGLRISDDPIESEGLKRARSTAETADVAILVLDASRLPRGIHEKSFGDFTSKECRKLQINLENSRLLVLINKSDLIEKTNYDFMVGSKVCAMSCKTEDGLEQFLTSFKKLLSELCANPLHESPLITNSRQRLHLQKCHRHLGDFMEIVHQPRGDLALAGQQLRQAAKQIGFITGQIETEEMLDILFHSFCIGK